MADLTLCTHADAARDRDLVPSMTDLVNTAFAEYEGVMQMSVDFMRWYMRRPGTDTVLCQVAMDGETAVANVFVATHPLLFRGESSRCGIIDSVATLPEYRHQGLARQLMERAHAAMAAAGLDLSVLYTNPEDHPYRFYQRLGYVTRARIDLLGGPRPADPGHIAVAPALEADHLAIRSLLAETGGAYDGFPELTDGFWRWHKLDRPAEAPVLMLVAREGQHTVGTATYCDTDIAIGGEMHRVSVLSDLALAPAAPEGTGLALLAAAPQPRIATLCDTRDPLHALFTELGFAREVSEVAMLLPLNAMGERIAATPPAPWFTMVESVIGV